MPILHSHVTIEMINVKVITLPKSNNILDVFIPVEALSSNMYIYRITKDQSPLYEGKFVKD